MKRLLIGFVVLTVLIFAACNPYLPLAWQLKGETFTYIIDGNGLDYITFTFNEDGTGGTMEMGYYTYGYATAAAETSGLYTDQSWYMNQGTRGTFTYDPETNTSVATITEVFARIPGVSTFYASDYSWRAFLTYQVEQNGTTVTAASSTMTQTVVFNSDTAAYNGFYIQNGENSWTSSMEETTNITDAGVETVTTSTSSQTITITNGALAYSTTDVDYEKVGTATPTIETWITNVSYAINTFFISGEATGDTEFEKAWKEGNTVTFMIQRTVLENIYYQGATAPAASLAPTVSGVTGAGSAGGGTNGVDLWTWDIDQDQGDSTFEVTYSNFGDFILDTDFSVTSYRGIE